MDLAGGRRPSGRTALGLHVNPDLHAKLILGVTPITAREGYRLLWRSGNSYTNEVTITDYPVGRVEFYPSRSRHIDLAPGMRGASAKPQRSIPLWYVYVPRYEPGREPEGGACKTSDRAPSPICAKRWVCRRATVSALG